MKVLLISPLPKLDPACGDVTYTETLLANPPKDVRYETYSEAMARGTLKEHGNRLALKQAIQTRQGLAKEMGLTATAKTVNLMRKAKWLFWEPFRFFSVKPGEYDIIHLHVFSAKFLNLPCPLVVSNAAPLCYLYSEARSYSARRTRRLENIEIKLGRALSVNVNSYHLPQATRVIAFTQYLKNWYIERGIMPAEKVDVVPIYLPSAPIVYAPRLPRRIGFIAKDFDAKGGTTLLRAYELVRAKRPDVELYIVGSPPCLDAEEAKARGITWIPYVPRDILLREILPSFDLFAYPTGFDGLPLVVLEAMERGIPIATSDYQAMPEMVADGKAGLISPVGNEDSLAHNIFHLLEPDMNRDLRCASRKHFDEFYSAEAVQPLLRASYEAAIYGNKALL